MFNNEHLRRHKIINGFYEQFRLWFYGRNIDIETFRIDFPTAQYNHNYFTFEKIYSIGYGIVDDTVLEMICLLFLREYFLLFYGSESSSSFYQYI